MAKRYYNLERETKEYLKASESIGVSSTIPVDTVNDYCITWKSRGRFVTKDTLLSRFGIVQNGLTILADPACPDSWNGSTFNDVFSNTTFIKHSTLSTPEYSIEFNTPSFLFKTSTLPLYRNSTIGTITPTLTSQEYSRFAVFRSKSFVSAADDFQPIIGNAYGGNQIDMGLCTGRLGKLTFNQYHNYNVLPVQRQANTSMELNRWYFGGFTHSKSLSTINFYLNGVSDGIATGVRYGNANTNTINIGGVDSPTVQTRYFDGYIGPVMHYNRVLNNSEILQIYNSYKSRFNL